MKAKGSPSSSSLRKKLNTKDRSKFFTSECFRDGDDDNKDGSVGNGHASLELKSKKTTGNDKIVDHIGSINKRPKKLTNRQAKRLEEEEARATTTAATNKNTTGSIALGRSKKKLSKKQARRLKREENLTAKNFKGPSAPEPGKKIGRSGNIAYGGHGDEWRNTSFAKRIGNNHMLRVKREQAARLKQLERQDSPASALSGKAKKQMLKEKRARKREQKRLQAAKEAEEAAIAAELAMQTALASRLELDAESTASDDTAPLSAAQDAVSKALSQNSDDVQNQ